MPAFSLRHVSRYRVQAGPDGSTTRTAVLRDVSLELASGQIHLLMGPSGSGKSTLLRLLNRLDDPDEGEIRLDGTPLRSFSVLELRRRVVLVGQQPAPFPGTVEENIAYGLRLQSLPPSEITIRVGEALQAVGLGRELLPRGADRLSVGQQGRMCLARALALRPEALLLDEPTAALDPASAAAVLRTVAALQRERGVTVVYVTHRREEAEALGGTPVYLEAGQIAEPPL